MDYLRPQWSHTVGINLTVLFRPLYDLGKLVPEGRYLLYSGYRFTSIPRSVVNNQNLFLILLFT